METAKDYIFISYSRDDLPKVRPVVEAMRNGGYNVWNDAKILPGEDWSNRIASHIKNCAVCVAFHSQTSRDSPHCREEIHYALKNGKTVISVYLEDVTLKDGLDMQLAPFQSVKYAEPTKLLETLRKSPDFERCGENIPDTPHKMNGVNMKTASKETGQRILAGWKFFSRKIFYPLGAIFLLVAILAALVIYGRRTPLWHIDESGVLDIVSPPLLKIEMPDYSYDSVDFRPPPWATKAWNLKCVVIRGGITRIGASSFQNCSNMEFVLIPESVTSIGTNAFSECTALKQVRLSESVQAIEIGAFENCAALEEITIPNSVRVIEFEAFSGCSNLKTVHIQSAPERVQVVNVILDSFVAESDTLYIGNTAFDPHTKIIYEPPASDS